jgi:hypothetical protein
MAEEKKQDYNAESIKVLEGLEGVRRRFDIVALSKKVRKQGDILILSQELKIRPRILKSAVDEGRILSFFPKLSKSKASILASLRTNRELKLFAEKYDIFAISARKLIKLVRLWNSEVQKNPFVIISLEEHDMIVGSLMGDASIRQREKNSCFRFTHSIKQKRYAEFKKKIVDNFNISEFREVKRRISDTFIHAIDFATQTHPIFNYYRNLFYKNGRKIITTEILNQLNPVSLAFWICDDGSYDNTQGYVVLCTNAYSFEEHQLMKEFFNKKFGLNPTIGFRDGKYYFLRFKQDDTKKLINLVKPFIPESMKYKIGEMKNVC